MGNTIFQKPTFNGDTTITVINNDSENKTVPSSLIEKKEISHSKLLLDRIIDFIISIIASIVATILIKYLPLFSNGFIGMFNYIFDETAGKFHMLWFILQLFLPILLYVFAFSFFISFIFNGIRQTKLKNEGSFFSKINISYIIYFIISFITSTNDKGIERIKHAYINKNGILYEIKYQICPFCQTKPIGKMFLYNNKEKNTFYWMCNRQPKHVLDFDYTENF